MTDYGELLRDIRAHGMSDPVLRLCADAIDALLAEVERLRAAFDLVPSPPTQADIEWAGKAHLHDALEENERLRDVADAHLRLAQDAIADADRLRDVLLRSGFVQCDSPACNCGSWHHRYGYPERFREIEELLQDNDIRTNGATLLADIKSLVDACYRLRKRLDAVREVYAGFDGFVPQTAPEAYCLRIIREMAHAAMGVSDE